MEYDRALYRVYERVLEDLTTSSSSSDAIIPRPDNTANGGAGNAARAQGPSLPFFLPMRCAPLVDVLVEILYGRLTLDGLCRRLRRAWLSWRAGYGSYSLLATPSGHAETGDADEEVGVEMNTLSSSGTGTGAGGGRARALRDRLTAQQQRRRRDSQRGRHVRLPTDEPGGNSATTAATTPRGGTLRRRGGNAPAVNAPSSGSGSGSSSATRTSGSSDDGDTAGSSEVGSSDSDGYDTPPAEDTLIPSPSPSRDTTPRRRRNRISSGEAGTGNAGSGHFFGSSSGSISNVSAADAADATGSSATNDMQGRRRRGRRQTHRRNHRRRRRRDRERSPSGSDSDRNNGPNDDSNGNNDNDDDDDDDDDAISGGGCTQKGVYSAIRTSSLLAWTSLWMLYCLHSTYVGAGVVGRRGGWWRGRSNSSPSAADSHGRVGSRGGAGPGVHGIGRRLVGSGAAGGDYEDGNAMMTCIEYALRTRPPGDGRRSGYYDRFGDEDDDDDADGDKVGKDADDHRGDGGGGGGGGKVGTRKARTKGVEDTEGKGGGRHGNLRGSSQTATKQPAAIGKASTKEEEGKKKGNIDPPLLGRDEILQIKILYGGRCTGQCSRVRNVVYPPRPTKKRANSTIMEDDAGDDDGDPILKRTDEGARGVDEYDGAHAALPGGDSNNSTWRQRGFFGRLYEPRSSRVGGNNNSSKVDPHSTPTYWETPHYRFATDEALLYLDRKVADLHNISVVNVTLTERCLSTGSDHGATSFVTATGEFLSQMFGMDSPVVNQLMYGIRTADGGYRNGYLQNVDTKERWSWKKDVLESYDGSGNPFGWFFGKVGSLILSLLSFFLITSVTALIVRVLTSSGVVMMFPVFALFRYLGLPGADDRILGLSYPWIGRARVAIGRGRVHPDVHLIAAHMAKIFLYYIMYEACQAAWSVVLYGKSIPEALPIWIYGFTMVWEYFNMVFVRSAMSAYFFPRITLLYFILYHLYFYSVPYGYFDVALIPWFLFMAQAMFYTLLALEVPAVMRGAISVECPREVYNRLSWPEWTASLPQEWTLFLPLNSRYTPLYDREVSDVGAGDPQEAEEEQGDQAMDTNGAAENGSSPGDEGQDDGPSPAEMQRSSINRLGLHSRGSGSLHEV